MAGPGGGPPRRSHTKSRKGCESCKRRHIRCDENFPQCRNCTKHKVRCPYNDAPPPEDRSTTPDKPDLMWTPQVEDIVAQWQNTGVFPFPGLNVYPTPRPEEYAVDDLRLIHHVASICDELSAVDADQLTLWTRQIPTVIQIGATNRYVMHALLAFAAMHIAYLTDCPLVGNLAFEHRGIALKGLQQAIDSFSPETSDAVLAASLVLSWQATDWRGWTQLMQGTSTVIDAMESWKHESQFGEFISESITFPTAPASPVPDHRLAQPNKEDLDMFYRAQKQIQMVDVFLKQTKSNTKAQEIKLVQQLLTFMKGARKLGPSRSVEERFDRLRDLRTWLFWLPVQCLQQTGDSPNTLVIIAHYYAVGLLVERLFPEVGAAYFGSLSLNPIDQVARRLMAHQNHHGGLEAALALMEFPIDTVSEFRSRMGWINPTRTPSFPQFNPPNFYANEPPVAPPPMPETTAYVYRDSFTLNYSTEELPMLKTESIPGSATSPLSLSSPFPTPQFLLSIPSPSYAAYSPASSTFEDSYAYSDGEFGCCDTSGYAHSPHLADAASQHCFGAGFVNTSIPVWN